MRLTAAPEASADVRWAAWRRNSRNEVMIASSAAHLAAPGGLERMQPPSVRHAVDPKSGPSADVAR
jgi:hypothetical protein